jgi:predicted dehydrogenase
VAASDRGSGGGQVLLSLGVVVSQLVQVGVLGTSYWVADFHLPALRSHAGARVRAICGRDRRRTQALAEQHDLPEVYTDYRAMIDSSELDALVVVMPEDLHHPMVMAGVEAGLHVLCEKPMAFMADRSGEMLAAAERARVKHMVQFTNRGLPHYRWIKHLLEDGYIGMPYHAYFTRPTGWYPAQQPNSYFWWADARRAKGA